MSDRFYTPDPLPPGEYALAGPDAHHLLAVRRLGPGDAVTLFNGDGCDYPAVIVGGDRKRVLLTVGPGVPADRERHPPVWVASALPKGDRADYLVEKLTELGAARFTPLVCARSVVVPKPGAEEKFRRQVIEASKQCGRNRLMHVDPPTPFAALLARPDLPAARLILHTDPRLTAAGATDERIVAVGPEGGFTPEEVSAALAAGWRCASLGPRVLRVETAATAAVTTGVAPRAGGVSPPSAPRQARH